LGEDLLHNFHHGKGEDDYTVLGVFRVLVRNGGVVAKHSQQDVEGIGVLIERVDLSHPFDIELDRHDRVFDYLFFEEL
jgi:hypothetical protein